MNEPETCPVVDRSPWVPALRTVSRRAGSAAVSVGSRGSGSGRDRFTAHRGHGNGIQCAVRRVRVQGVGGTRVHGAMRGGGLRTWRERVVPRDCELDSRDLSEARESRGYEGHERRMTSARRALVSVGLDVSRRDVTSAPGAVVTSARGAHKVSNTYVPRSAGLSDRGLARAAHRPAGPFSSTSSTTRWSSHIGGLARRCPSGEEAQGDLASGLRQQRDCDVPAWSRLRRLPATLADDGVMGGRRVDRPGYGSDVAGMRGDTQRNPSTRVEGETK